MVRVERERVDAVDAERDVAARLHGRGLPVDVDAAEAALPERERADHGLVEVDPGPDLRGELGDPVGAVDRQAQDERADGAAQQPLAAVDHVLRAGHEEGEVQHELGHALGVLRELLLVLEREVAGQVDGVEHRPSPAAARARPGACASRGAGSDRR